MLLISILTFFALVLSFVYIYFAWYLKDGIIWFLVPIIFLISFLIVFILLVLFLMLAVSLHSKKTKVLKPRRFYSTLIYLVVKMLQVFYNIEIVFEGKQLLPENQQFLLVLNHQSNLDPLMVVASFKDMPITYVMKDNLMKVPFVGRFLHASGFLPLDRKNDRKAMEAIVQGINRLKAGYPLAVYPEGTRSRSPEMGEFRNGVFKLAQKAEVPLLVIALDGFYKVRHRFPFLRTKVLIRICEVIPYEEIKDLHTNDIGNRVREVLQKNLDEARAKYSWLR